MIKRKVLIFIDWFLPGERAGGPVRSCINLIDHLSDEFDFSVVTRNTDYTSDVVYPNVRSDEWNVLPNGMRVFYFSEGRLSRGAIRDLIARESPDVIYLNSMWSEPFTQWPLKCTDKKKTKVVLAVRGMLAPSAMAIKSLKKKTFLSLAKIKGVYDGVIFHATNEREAIEIKGIFGLSACVRVAANLPRKTLKPNDKTRVKQKDILRVVDISRYAPEKNNLFALEVLMKCKAPIEADFFGSVYDRSYFSHCEELVKRMPSNVKVKLHDAVPSDMIAEILPAYDLLLLPSRGENFGHIILESFQSGVPVLISDKTPWKDLAGSNAGWDFSLDNVAAFSSRLDTLAALNETSFSVFRKGAKQKAKAFLEESGALDASRKLFD